MKKCQRFFPILCCLGIFYFIAISGCINQDAYLRQQVATKTGCSPDSVTIEEINKTSGIMTSYTAKCNGKTYYCGRNSGAPCTEVSNSKRKK